MPFHAAQYAGKAAGCAAEPGTARRVVRGCHAARADTDRAHAGGKVMPANLVDGFGRVHDSLRISVTDRCNIRCFYCMPENGVHFMDRSEILTFEEIERFVRAAVPLGISKLRLTGGEPLLRRELPRLIEKLAAIPGIRDMALTTNAVLLREQAADLYRAGLRRLNIHLDTLDRARFERITRRDDLPRVLAGIDAAVDAGFEGIKLN